MNNEVDSWNKILEETYEKELELRAFILRNYNSVINVIERNVGSLPDGAKILEAGCGSGIETIFYAQQMVNVETYLLDYSLYSALLVKKSYKVINSKENWKTNGNFINGNTLKLPFRDNSFDLVWNNGVCEHFDGEERQKVFNELARVCKKKGKVFITVPNAHSPFFRLNKKILESLDLYPKIFEKPFSRNELKECVRKAGLTILQCDGYGFFNSFFEFLTLVLRSNNNGKANLKNINSQRFLNMVLRKILHENYAHSSLNRHFGNFITILAEKDGN
jgi:SAM-dependent methyltransferase